MDPYISQVSVLDKEIIVFYALVSHSFSNLILTCFNYFKRALITYAKKFQFTYPPGHLYSATDLWQLRKPDSHLFKVRSHQNLVQSQRRLPYSGIRRQYLRVHLPVRQHWMCLHHQGPQSTNCSQALSKLECKLQVMKLLITPVICVSTDKLVFTRIRLYGKTQRIISTSLRQNLIDKSATVAKIILSPWS